VIRSFISQNNDIQKAQLTVIGLCSYEVLNSV
jgi:hypothetical protein